MKIKLSNIKDQKALWKFIKIDNLMEKFDSKEKIHRDAYFRIKHKSTDFYLGFNETDSE